MKLTKIKRLCLDTKRCELTTASDGARAAREKALAAALQIRLAIRGLRQALPLLNALSGLDADMAATVTGELKKLAEEMI